MVYKSLVTLTTKRIPLIKFRKGGPSAGSIASNTPSAVASGKVNTASKISSPSTALEDWQLPARYRRKPLDPIEIDYINRGGPP